MRLHRLTWDEYADALSHWFETHPKEAKLVLDQVVLSAVARKAAQLAQWEMIEGDPNGWKTSLKRVEASTPAAVQAAARKWLTRGSQDRKSTRLNSSHT